MDNFSNFLFMRSEVSLLVVILALLVFDLTAGKRGMRYFQPIAIILLAIHTILHLLPHEAGIALCTLILPWRG